MLAARPDVLNHNTETVPRLYRAVRRAGATRARSNCSIAPAPSRRTFTKTGMMMGLGEELDEVVEVFKDLRQVGVAILTLGQYLRPSENHAVMTRYYHPDEFRELKRIAMGWDSCTSRPARWCAARITRTNRPTRHKRPSCITTEGLVDFRALSGVTNMSTRIHLVIAVMSLTLFACAQPKEESARRRATEGTRDHEAEYRGEQGRAGGSGRPNRPPPKGTAGAALETAKSAQETAAAPHFHPHGRRKYKLRGEIEKR